MGYFKQLSADGVTDLRSYSVGDRDGLETAVIALRAEIYAVTHPMMVDKEYLDGLKRAVELVEAILATKDKTLYDGSQTPLWDDLAL